MSETIIYKILTALLASSIFLYVKNRVSTWYPNEVEISERIKQSKYRWQKVEFQFDLMLILFIWLFLGMAFWIISDALFMFQNFLFNEFIDPDIKTKWKTTNLILNAIVFGVEVFSMLCFLVGLHIVNKIVRVRKLLI